MTILLCSKDPLGPFVSMFEGLRTNPLLLVRSWVLATD